MSCVSATNTVVCTSLASACMHLYSYFHLKIVKHFSCLSCRTESQRIGLNPGVNVRVREVVSIYPELNAI